VLACRTDRCSLAIELAADGLPAVSDDTAITDESEDVDDDTSDGCDPSTCFSEVGRAMHYLGEPTPLREIPGVVLETPGPATHSTNAGGTDLWCAGDGTLSMCAFTLAVEPDDARTPEERVAEIAEGMGADADEELLVSEATEWMGAPAHDVEFTDHHGTVLNLARIIDLPDGRILGLVTAGSVDLELDAIDLQASLVASLASA
jgi:hypothetical protein